MTVDRKEGAEPMGFMERILARLLRPKVVDRSPGRLCVRVAILSKVPPHMRDHTAMLEALLEAPRSIESAEICLDTGTIELRYDAGAADEERVFGYVTGVFEFFTKVHGEVSTDGLRAEIQGLIRELDEP